MKDWGIMYLGTWIVKASLHRTGCLGQRKRTDIECSIVIVVSGIEGIGCQFESCECNNFYLGFGFWSNISLVISVAVGCSFVPWCCHFMGLNLSLSHAVDYNFPIDLLTICTANSQKYDTIYNMMHYTVSFINDGYHKFSFNNLVV